MSQSFSSSADLLPAMDVAPLGVTSLQYSAVYLVDGDKSAYQKAPAGINPQEIDLRYLATAAEALRIPKYQAPLLYLVNVTLSDMSGFELYGMLRERWPRVPGYLISDTYSMDDEIRARCTGSTLYFCKPLVEGWLASMLKVTTPAAAPVAAVPPPTRPALLWKRPMAHRLPQQGRFQ